MQLGNTVVQKLLYLRRGSFPTIVSLVDVVSLKRFNVYIDWPLVNQQNENRDGIHNTQYRMFRIKCVKYQDVILCNCQYKFCVTMCPVQGRRLRVASGATTPGPALEGAPRFRPMSLSSYILR